MVAQSPSLDPAHEPALDGVFHALAHPARREMLRSLARGERNLTELAAPLEMSFPAASKHVRVLERAHLVSRRVEGRRHICSIESQPLAQANQWLEDYRRLWEANFQRLDAVLEELKAAEAAQREPEPPDKPAPAKPAPDKPSADNRRASKPRASKRPGPQEES